MAKPTSTPAKPLPELQPGDVLFYKPAGLFGRLITIKTWGDYSHVELYEGSNPETPIWGSRNPESLWKWREPTGVRFYPFRAHELGLVRRPITPVDVAKLHDFTTSTVGQKYDWLGLLKFFRISKGKMDRMFCSEAVTRALRVATSAQLFDNVDADGVSPSMLSWTPELTDIWRA